MDVVSEPMRVYRVGLGRIGASALFWRAVAAAPAALVVGRLLEPHGLGLVLRLAGAAACVLLPPRRDLRAGARQAAHPRRHDRSVVRLEPRRARRSLALTFALDGTIDDDALSARRLRGGVARARPRARAGRRRARERKALAGLVAGGVLFAGAVWWSANSIYGDGLFHLGRVQKLATLDLTSLNVVDEFRHGGLHPGYAFPVWHSAVALVAKLADVQPAVALTHLPAILTPLAIVLAYAAGAALFRSYGGGIATAAAQVGLLAFARSGTGSFDFLAYPPTVARALITPALLALVFSVAAGGKWRGLLSISAASLALALVHPSYAFFVVVPIFGFLAARVALATRRWHQALRIAAAIPAILLPAGLYALWLKPIVDETVSHRPDKEQRALDIAHYSGQVDVVHGLLRLAPETISRGGAVAIAGLLAIPLAAAAAPRRWGAYVLGGSLAVLVILFVPWVFDHFADAVSLSQARRLAAFLPLPFAVAGASALVGRYRLGGCLAAFGAGALLQLAYPGEFSYFLVVGGPALARVDRLRRSGDRARRRGRRAHAASPRRRPVWTAAVALSLVAPVGPRRPRVPEAGRARPASPHPGPRARAAHGSPASGRRLLRSRDELPDRGVRAGLRRAAPPAHVADTTKNMPQKRRKDVIAFLHHRDLALPRHYGADWVVIAKRPSTSRSRCQGLRGRSLHPLQGQPR